MKAQKRAKQGVAFSAKELARTAVFVAAVIGAQYALAAVPFVEIVSLLFACPLRISSLYTTAITRVITLMLRRMLWMLSST